MAAHSLGTSPSGYLKQGTRGLLIVGDKRYLVAILSAQDGVLRVSFSTRDYPVSGMSVTLEFHEETGYAAFECEVLETPQEVGDGLRLRLLRDNATESCHRGAWRVPAALPLSIKGHVHPRRYTGTAENVSAHGMLMATEAQLEAGDNFDFTITLQDNDTHQAIGQVMHVLPGNTEGNLHHYGVRFVGADPVLLRSVARYVWQHVRVTVGLESPASE